MKKTLYLFAVLFCFFSFKPISLAQIGVGTPPDTLFEERFDSIPSKWKMVSSWTPANQINRWWRDSIVTKDGSTGSATDTINTSGQGFTAETHLTSPLIYFDGYTSVGFAFEHICYIGTDNDATVQYSFDDGVTWNRMPPSSYKGSLVYDFGQGDFKFNKLSNAADWRVLDTSYIWPANTNAWVTEDFDLTDVIISSGTASDSVRIRFTLINDPAAPRGREGTHRWIIENFVVRGADCELVPPTLELLDPPRNYPVRYEGRVYSEGPWDFDAKITDRSGVDTAVIVGYLKSNVSIPPAAPQWDTVARDTFPMQRLSGGNFQGKITSPIDGIDVKIGDTIIWKVIAFDRSDCANGRQDPPEGFSSFRVVNDLPKSCNTQPIYQFPYFQDFNSTNFFVTQQPATSIVDLAEDWENVGGDFHEWYVNQGPTPTGNTGPSDDIPGGGKYLFVESTTYQDSTAFLVTPCFDFADDALSNGLVKFYLNLNTNSIDDSINIDIFDPNKPGTPFGGFVNNVIPAVKGNKGDNWLPFEFSTFPYKNTVTQIRFRASPGTNTGFGDMAIDSFSIKPAPDCDLRMNAIDLPPYGPAGERDELLVNLQNLGIADANNIEIFYQTCPADGSFCDPANAPSIIYPGPLSPGVPVTITLPTDYPILNGDFFLKTWLSHPCNDVKRNDTAFSNSTGIAYRSLKYRDNFDKDTLWRSLAVNDPLENKWELGTPNYARTNSAFSEPNAWDVLLDRQYTGSGITNSLISPIYDFRGADSIIISFLNNRDIDTTKDGVWIEWSLNRGRTWQFLENFDDIESIRWYNNTLSSGGLGGTPVFAGESQCWGNTWGGYLESELYLPEILDNKEEVMFRFQFFAENDEDGNAGFSLDNLLIYDPDPIDIEPFHLLGPVSECDLSDETQFYTIFKNRGMETINSFEVEYRVTHLLTQTVESKTDVVNRTFDHRDTIHVYSESKLDMFKFGDYKVEIIAKLPGDGCQINDTLTRFIENIEGCSLKFVIETSFRRNLQRPCDSSVWRFRYTSGDRSYEVSRAFNDPKFAIGRLPNIPGDTIDDMYVCIKSNSQVRFDLDDIDTLVDKYSFVAFNGENDTIIRRDITGGPDSPTQFFDWTCPPDSSATPIEILFDNRLVQLPVAKTNGYLIETIILNNGLDSIDNLEVYLKIDERPTIFKQENFFPPLKYNRTARVTFTPNQILEPGVHTLTVWTRNPNGNQDELPGDDTITTMISIMDTIKLTPFCEDFEGTSGFFWPTLNTYNYNQNESNFELGVPNSPNLTGTSNAWTTRLNGTYPNIDSSSIISPFFLMEKDSCYKISFNHNYYITDSLQDGGHVQLTSDTGKSWMTIGNNEGDSAIFGQLGWYNTLHILAIPDNSMNSGWTGVSNGWKAAENVIGSTVDQYIALRWRFESDASGNSDGWAVDDFCIETLDSAGCLPVGLADNKFDKSELYLGQNIPNPASQSTSIPYYLPNPGEVQFMVTNLMGQQVYFEELERPSGDGLFNLDLSSMAKGVYFYTLTFEGQRYSNKMIVTK